MVEERILNSSIRPATLRYWRDYLFLNNKISNTKSLKFSVRSIKFWPLTELRFFKLFGRIFWVVASKLK